MGAVARVGEREVGGGEERKEGKEVGEMVGCVVEEGAQGSYGDGWCGEGAAGGGVVDVESAGVCFEAGPAMEDEAKVPQEHEVTQRNCHVM